MTKDNIQKKTLSIRISTNGFCFCSYTPTDPDGVRYYTYQPDEERSIASNIQTAFESCPFTRQGNTFEIKAIIETDKYTCLPAEYDNAGDYKQYFDYCFPNSHECEIIANKLNAHGYTVLFPVEKSICEAIKPFGEATYYTPTSIIMSYLGYKPMKEEQYMFAYLYNDLALIITMKNGKTELTNIFHREDDCNTLFYLLSIWKEQGLSQTNDTLYICGDNSIEPFTIQASQFIKKIKRINSNELFPANLLNKVEGIPFDMQALILCE